MSTSTPSGTSQTVPTIRSFQFDDRGIGAIKNSVNMFRGDANLSLPLLSLPGRNGRDVEIKAVYLSNVHDAVTRWNLDSPTGVLGLGWTLPYDRVEVDNKGTSSLEDNDWFLVRGNSRERMFRSDLARPLFELDATFADELRAGEVGPELAGTFAQAGLPLSGRTRVLAGCEGTSWRLLDDGEERSYAITLEGEALEVSDGGLAFELQSFKFQQICYEPDYERWRVIDEDGVIHVYGGGLSEDDGVPSAEDQVIQWGVRWGDWYGSSTLTEGQERFPTSWNLASTRDPWGNSVRYAYQVVEQAVGEGGLSYTKACYPALVTDTYGRTVSFEYAAKEYTAYDPEDPATAALPREYADPHKEVPSDAPNAWQDRYETLYLERMIVRDRDGQEMYTLVAGYEVASFTDAADSDPLRGDTAKRVLTSLVQINPYGESLPGIELDYYSDPKDPNPGALRTLTYPQGGTATYVYEHKSLPICERSLAVERPSTGLPDFWVPRVWFGEDYAVLVWFNTSSREMQVTVYTWLGFWYPWSTESMTFPAELDLDTLDVIARGEFFAIHWESDQADRTYLRLYHKIDNALGQWLPLDDEIVFPALRVELAAGDAFLVAVNEPDGELWRATWQARARQWEVETFPLSETFCSDAATSQREYFLGGHANLYTVLCYDRGGDPGERNNRIALYYLDALGAWHLGDSIAADDIDIARSGDAGNFYWRFGASFAVATWVTETSSATTKYDLRVYPVQADYQFGASTTEEFKVDTGVSFVPTVLADSFIGSGPNLLRFTGSRWESHDLTTALPPNSGNVFWFADGADLAMSTENGSSQVISHLAAFDPDVDSEGWQTPVRTLLDTTDPIDYRKLRFFPTAGTDYASWDVSIYYRGHGSQWLQVPDDPIYIAAEIDGGMIDTTTMQNQAPQFFAYLRLTDATGKLEAVNTTVVNLVNGRAGDIEIFDEQYYRIYDDGQPRGSLNGKLPAGPSSLMTWPLGEDLDAASHVTLRRNLAGTVAGRVSAWPVVRLEVDTGFEANPTVYSYDESTAVCDPSGQVIKFYHSERWVPAVDDPQGMDVARPSGWTEFLYINGLPDQDPARRWAPGLYALRGSGKAAQAAAAEAAANFSVLDGYLLQQSDFDAAGELVSRKTTDWQVHFAVWAAPGDPGTELPILGAYVLSPSDVRSQDGVVTLTRYEYDLATGQQAILDLDNTGSLGESEIRRKTTVYGCQVYPEMWNRNMLTQVAQDTNSVVTGASGDGTGDETEVPINASVTRYKAWTHTSTDPSAETETTVYDVLDEYAWRGGSSAEFTAWSPESDPGGDWLRMSVVEARSPETGVPLESRDAMDRVTSTLWDSNDQYQVAVFANASLAGEEASFLGFEAYEGDGGWTLQPSGASWRDAVVDGLGHTGRRCLALDESRGSLERLFTPARQNGTLLFSAWYRTPAGWAPGTEPAGWVLTLERGGEILETLELPFADTGGAWIYQSTGIDLAPYAGGGTVSLRARASQPGAATVYLDDLRLSALAGDFSAGVFDSRYDLMLASMGPSLQTDRKIYDDFQRLVGCTGPTDNVQRVGTQYLSRQGDGSFSADFPNSAVSAQGSGQGFYSDFWRDGDWQGHWASDDPGAWSVEQGELVKGGDGESEIRLQEPSITERYAAYVLATPDGAPSSPLGIAIGERLRIAWDPATGDWSLSDAGSGASSLQAPRRQGPRRSHCTWGRGPHVRWLEAGYAPRLRRRAVPAAEQGRTGEAAATVQREWFVVVAGRQVQFFADGEQVIAYTAADEVQGELRLFATDPVAFSDILLSDGLQLSVTYSDGAGNVRQVLALQSQALQESQDPDPDRTVINATLYDEQGRGGINTKPAFVEATAEAPLLAYRPDFVTAFDPATGVMRGLVADYYSAGGGGFSDDEGYPYTWERYEASPLGRPVEQGLPGKDFAIVDLGSTEPAERHTTRYAYSANGGDGFMDHLPPGEYGQKTTYDPDGNVSAELTDKAGEKIAQGNLVDGAWVTTAYEYGFASEGQTVTTRLPNAFAPPKDSVPEDWQTVTFKDPLGRVLRLTTPDAGDSEMIYDNDGNLRFQQSAEGRDKGYYLYFRYDVLERPVENGFIEGAWDAAVLEVTAAEHPDEPVAPDTWQSRSAYDGDGADPLAVGRLTSVSTSTGDGDGVTSNVESYRYDARGNVLASSLRFEEGDDPQENLAYTYDNLNHLKEVDYQPPTETGDAESESRVSYHFDGLGWLRSIGRGTDNPDAYALYDYNADGSTGSAQLAAGDAGSRLERRFGFNSPGWTTGSSDPVFTQSVYYTTDADGAPGYYNGLPAGERVEFHGELPSGAVSNYTYRYEFDALSRITAALNSSDGVPQSEWSLGADDRPVLYDANGNLIQLTRGSELLDYHYLPGTDKLDLVTSGTGSQSFGYDADGGVDAASGKGIATLDYNRTLRLPQRVVKDDGGEIRYRYGGSDRRVLKESADQRIVYVHGSYMRPLVERFGDGSATRYVYGPGGLVAFERDGQSQLVLPDRLGSSRALVDAGGQVVAVFSYLPFGGTLNQAGQADLRYLFTGQELESDLDLYNFKARFYDTVIGRFYATDPQNQFASPYVYAGNNPILIIDPTGQFSWAAALAITGGALAIVGGVALTVATGGAAAPLVVGEVTVLSASAVTVLGAAAGSAVAGAGLSSVVYSSTHTNNWNAADWAKNVAAGAVGGAISGGAAAGAAVAGAAATSAAITASVNAGLSGTAALGAGVAAGVGTGAAIGAVGGLASQLAENAILNPDDLTNGLLTATLMGAGSGLYYGAMGFQDVGGVKGAFNKMLPSSLRSTPSSFGSRFKTSLGFKVASAAYGIGSYYVDPSELLGLLGSSADAGTPQPPTVPLGTSTLGTGPTPVPNSGGSSSAGGPAGGGTSTSGASGSAQPRGQAISQLRPKGFMMPQTQCPQS